jgi:uncharacterized protein YjiS (DUF1127 family)
MKPHLSPVRVHGPDISITRARLAPRLAGPVKNAGGHARRAVSLWRTHIRTERERGTFLAMPDHVLSDIGVSRFEILDVGSPWQFLRETRQ